ncbi:helix-turn-helix transcriptional regulator [Pseudogemmobacter sp. W21_MBD1_M6]|uniref:helix-turn-helix transcriptional regulator n=1 Tax=Pseudogemmobacter sp. W21_MBD1_M6 TaxID=3240271 RepID=UPI003F9E90DB
MSKAQQIYVRMAHVHEAFGIHKATAYRAAQRGELTIYKRGVMSFLKVAEVEQWIEKGVKAA